MTILRNVYGSTVSTYATPLNSYDHHDMANTPESIREACPSAFSVVMATIGKKKMEQGHDALLAAVHRADILLVNAWHAGPHTEIIKDLYREAAREAGVRTEP